jgi:hypothetical protein
VQGTLRGESIKKALDLRSWEAASDLIRGWEASGEIGVVRPEVPSVAEAVEKFITYQKSRHLAEETLRKYESLLQRRLLDWCKDTGRAQLKQLRVDALRDFQQSWSDSAIYAVKNLERLRAFFDFCLDAQWIERNPARLRRAGCKHFRDVPQASCEVHEVLFQLWAILPSRSWWLQPRKLSGRSAAGVKYR